MNEEETAELVKDFGEINSPLRNIRLFLDGTSLTVDLIPSVILDKCDPGDFEGLPKEAQKILQTTKPIVEAQNYLRLTFVNIAAVSIQEEFVSINEDLRFDELLPIDFDRKSFGNFTFWKINNSIWRNKLPEHEGGDNPDIRHYKIMSMECNVDILGILESGNWHRN